MNDTRVRRQVAGATTTAVHSGVWSASALIALLVLVTGCGALEFLDPSRCVEATGPIEMTLDDFRVGQTNQTPDHAIPLLMSRAAGVRVAIEMTVTRPTLSALTIEVDAVDSGGGRTRLLSESLTCVRPLTLASAHLGAEHVVDERSFELRVLDGAGELRIEASVRPSIMDAEPYALLLVPMRVNGIEVSTDTERFAQWSEEAFAMFPLEREASWLPTLDVGTVAASDGQAMSRVLFDALTVHIADLEEIGLLPPLSVVIGLIPREVRSWGRGGGFRGVTDELNRETFLHEIGHAVGAPHAYGCGAPDPWPDSTLVVHPPGYDVVTRTWRGGNDIMSYCRPRSWLGAWAHELIMDRLRHANDRGHVRVAVLDVW